jgi:hypothetical protein
MMCQNSNLETLVRSVIGDFIQAGVLFTALDVSNKVKKTLPLTRHREVRDVVRGCWTSDIEPAGYGRTPITVTLTDGTTVDALLYHPLADSWDLDVKYDAQKRAQMTAHVHINASTFVTVDNQVIQAQNNTRDLWDQLFKTQPSLFPRRSSNHDLIVNKSTTLVVRGDDRENRDHSGDWDDRENRDNPGGWDYYDEPITFATLIDDPYEVKPISDLTEAKKWALVIARIRKRLNFSMLVPGLGTFVRSFALRELENKSHIGLIIRNLELDWLDQYRKDNIKYLSSINNLWKRDKALKIF